MAEGKLYCEKCGEDIHIVPDFEPELERNLEQTIHTILEELGEEGDSSADGAQMDPADGRRTGSADGTSAGGRRTGSADGTSAGGRRTGGADGTSAGGRRTGSADGTSADGRQADTADGSRPRGRHGRRRSRTKVLPVLGFLLVLAAGGTAWLAYGYHSEEYQVGRAAQYVAAQKYDRAISCYNRALELDSGNVELLFSLAEVYYLKNNKIEYEYLLREIVKSGNATAEQLEGAYDKLIAIYRAREDYQTINTLLLASGNEKLLSTYQAYIAKEPEFSIKEGYYTNIQPLKLTAAGTGKIYYTMDGSEPTEDSAQYTAPIILENGDYVVKAFFVNDKGIDSGVVSKEYHIKNDEIPAPGISAFSGKYSFPVNIEVTSDDDEDIYYTTDGSTPTYFSNVYTGPIPMPLGRSTYKFARIVDGVTGTVAERSYQLVMNTDYTPEQAVDSIVAYFMRSGRFYDEDGHYDDSGSSYCFEYQYVTNINSVDDFYVIAEIFRGTDGSLTRTGSNFAVNAYTGELFRLQQDDGGGWSLVVMEEPEVYDEDDEEEE